MGNTTNTSDFFQLTPKNPYLNKPPKKIFGKFPTQKISEMKISNPPKSFDHPCPLTIWSTSLGVMVKARKVLLFPS